MNKEPSENSDVESLLSQLSLCEPSADLDESIAQICSSPNSLHSRAAGRLRFAVALVASLAVGVLIGLAIPSYSKDDDSPKMSTAPESPKQEDFAPLKPQGVVLMDAGFSRVDGSPVRILHAPKDSRKQSGSLKLHSKIVVPSREI